MSAVRLVPRGLAAALAALVAAAPALPAQVVAITGGTVYPVSGPKVAGATVLIRDGKVVAVGTDVAVPAGARRIDATGKVVTPGFIHVATQAGLGVGRAQEWNDADDEYTAIGGTSDASRQGDVKPSFNVREGIDPQAIAIPVTRAGGVTTALSLPSGGMIAGQGVVIDLAGEDVSAMVVKDPAVLRLDVGPGSRAAGGGSRAAAMQRLRELFRDAVVLADRDEDYEEGDIRPLAAPAEDLRALLPVLEGKLPVYIEADRETDIRSALRLASEFKLKLVISGGREAWRVAKELAAAKVPVITDPRDNLPNFNGVRARADNAALLREAGVTVLLGGNDAGGDQNLRFTAGHAVRNGMPWDDALAAVTLEPARALGLAGYGTLAAGSVANVVVWSGDPFELSTGVDAVLIRGQEVPLTSRMTELRERYRTLPPKY